MKTSTKMTVLVALLALAGCGIDAAGTVSDQTLGTDVARGALGAHVPASYCELFVDKITPYQGSHALRALNLWVKVLPSRLDGPIAEVGFRNSQVSFSYPGGPVSSNRDWTNDAMQPFFGAADYFQLSLPLASDYGATTYQGAFYVRTTTGTTYWAKAGNGGDFVFDRRTHDIVASRRVGYSSGYESSIDVAVPTQASGMDYYNLGRCR
jgi:hypothetical protein